MNIETIETIEGNSVSFCTERGGIITSLILQGIELLYIDTVNLENKNEKVHGGIPVLFPNAGALTDNSLPQHGFARDMEWESEPYERGFIENLISTDQSKRIYPYDFKLSLLGRFEEDNSFTLIQDVRNLDSKDMPIACGLHPYFKVPNDKKKDILFNFSGGEVIQEQFELWSKGQKISIDNPGTPLQVTIPDLGTLILNYSKEYKKIWIWSESGKDFICIEPVMRDEDGITNDPEIIVSDDDFGARISIALK